jgi:hypothetical protein
MTDIAAQILQPDANALIPLRRNAHRIGDRVAQIAARIAGTLTLTRTRPQQSSGRHYPSQRRERFIEDAAMRREMLRL